ncbi:hypothetical protein JHK82_050641 [Glycine max]|uniref:DUF7588 domain-containing protein n=1 Tax=Glycine max TaxID=3847 RepID=A0A0R0F0W4_SOYBN|nr:hypothetical protein JHK86_050493 [Glycine max]KAG4936433.1 hypothetical protein JHK85_051352 [Glycine max]KAG5091863.1 hypothetical protein JHK82_050641 [Glycine max]
MDDWSILEIPQDSLYVPETIKDKHNFDYIIKTVENNIPLGQDLREEFHLLSKNSIYEHSRKYKYLHIGYMDIDVVVLMCLRDIRHNKFEDSLIGTGMTHGLDMKEGSIPTTLIYRIQYKVMNTCETRVFLKPQRGETTLFITDMTKANVSLPRTIKWDEATLFGKWVMDKATLSVPRPAPTIEQIKQDNSGKVEITFNRRNSFSSRLKASRSGYESARRSLLNKRTTKSQSNLQHTLLCMNLVMLSEKFSIDKDTLRKDFYSPENEPQRRWFFQHFKGSNRKQIQEKFYEFVERVKINVLFFDWFYAYIIRENIDYPWKQDIIGNPTTNVITNWQIKDGELIQSELPPTTQYQLPKANYTNKYLQVLGESIKSKATPK